MCSSTVMMMVRVMGLVCVCMVCFLVWGCLGFVGDSDGKFSGTLRKVCERCGVCGQKTGLTIRIQNGSRDFRNREKVFERQKTGKRFQAENQGFQRGFGVWKRVKLRSFRLGLWVVSVVWTEKRKETWPQNAQKGAKEAGKEAARVGTAERGEGWLLGDFRAGSWKVGRRHEKSRIPLGTRPEDGEGLGLSAGTGGRRIRLATRQRGEGERSELCTE